LDVGINSRIATRSSSSRAIDWIVGIGFSFVFSLVFGSGIGLKCRIGCRLLWKAILRYFEVIWTSSVTRRILGTHFDDLTNGIDDIIDVIGDSNEYNASVMQDIMQLAPKRKGFPRMGS
jgi:hypothetical protein